MEEAGPQSKQPKYTCRVCLDQPAIYQCPRCLLRSCSASCAQRHKTQDECDGQPKRVEDKPLKAMGDSDLEKDIRFLETVGGSIERQARQDSILSAERYNVPAPRSIAPNLRISKHSLGLRLLRERAQLAHVFLKTCPPSLARRKANTTCLSSSRAAKVLRWRLEWILYVPNRTEPIVIIDRAVSQETRTATLIARFSAASKPFPALKEVEGLQSVDDFIFALVDESLPCNRRGYLQLDSSKKLKEWLAGSLIVEFPTIHMIPKSEIKPPSMAGSSEGDCIEVTASPLSTEEDSSISSGDSSDEDSSSSDSSSDVEILEVPSEAPKPLLMVPRCRVQTRQPPPPPPPPAPAVTEVSQPASSSEDDEPSPLTLNEAAGPVTERAQMLEQARGDLVGTFRGKPIWEKRYLFEFESAPYKEPDKEVVKEPVVAVE
eukprot:Protomagalhaensia_sp_Gyna_25__6078@NODE_972_length_2340_cov_1382_710995_g772_i0_p1_GENE_NODE_972_length_2340_cov_1382_710995_g772_i0NODE_972_length_2340_cov_1382_710995_g772_i0_p1_ORF_typecomplete_len432_score71_26zfHIT/PF04438_16/2e05zfMYST/PF17772_1/1_1Mito_fiss_reg/PF05308_11/2_4PRIMA1/PF16101_5/3_3CAP_N/PF01213_19/6_NODE_972_length_2340_cov_1382_710995_g772_i031298